MKLNTYQTPQNVEAVRTQSPLDVTSLTTDIDIPTTREAVEYLEDMVGELVQMARRAKLPRLERILKLAYEQVAEDRASMSDGQDDPRRVAARR